MTVKVLEQKVKTLERRLVQIEKEIGAPAYSVSRKAEIQDALRAVSGMWAKNPRTKADLTRVRGRLGLN